MPSGWIVSGIVPPVAEFQKSRPVVSGGTFKATVQSTSSLNAWSNAALKSTFSVREAVLYDDRRRAEVLRPIGRSTSARRLSS